MIKFYVMSMDMGETYLPDILEYNSLIPDYFEGVKPPKHIQAFDTWDEGFRFLLNYGTLKQQSVVSRVLKLTNELTLLSIDAGSKTEQLKQHIAKLKEVKQLNEDNKQFLTDIIKEYGKYAGDVTQEMLEAVLILS